MLQETIYRANLAPISAVEAAKQASLALIYAENQLMKPVNLPLNMNERQHKLMKPLNKHSLLLKSKRSGQLFGDSLCSKCESMERSQHV